jgi:tellurite resistance protein TerC
MVLPRVFLLVMLIASMAVSTQALYPPKEMTAIPSSPTINQATKNVQRDRAFVRPSVAPPPPLPPAVVAATADTAAAPHTHPLEVAEEGSIALTEAAGVGSMTTHALPASVVSAQEYRTALFKTLLTVTSACLFGVFLTLTRGKTTGYEFFCSYLVEQSLSIDNIFVFIMLFDYFQVPLESQSRVLAWGITGAIALRGVMILLGVAVLQRFKSVLLVFAAILLASSYKLLTESHSEPANSQQDQQQHVKEENAVMKIASYLFPNTTHEFHGQDFFVQQNGHFVATPLLLCLVCVELSDFVFAVDSIPAVLGVTQDPLVVYSSNIFAIMALRSLYTVVAKAVAEWHYLKPAVALVLGFVGSKMILEYFHFHVGTDVSLGVISTLLAGGVAMSVWETRRKGK